MNEYPIYYTMEKLKGKWSIIILCFLNEGPKHNGELLRLIPYVSQKMLTEHLRRLENENLITREVLCYKPLSVKYSLSEYGETLKPILSEMKRWGEINNPEYSKELVAEKKAQARTLKLKDL